MNPCSRQWIAAVLSLGLSGAGLFAQNASVPDATSDDGTGPAVKLEKFTVTGSNIPTARDTQAVPVTIIGQTEIQQSGQTTNLLEVLKKRMPEFTGRSNTGNTNANSLNQNTAGGSKLSMRNLDTLVLVNGRRVATSGIDGIGGKSFVDINKIPVAAIDRIEVLKDGASAIYGSDAVGGVVNIILRSDYQGAEVGGNYAVSAGQGGTYTERSAYVVAGAKLQKLNLTVSASWAKSDPLLQRQRAFSSQLFNRTTNIPGAIPGSAILAPNLNSPSQTNPTGTAATAPNIAALIANGTYLAATNAQISSTFNNAPYQSLLVGQDQRAIVANGSAELAGKRLEVYADVMVSKNKSARTFLPVNLSVAVPANSPYNPTTGTVGGVIVSYLPKSRLIFDDADGLRINGGFRGEINSKWSWDIGYLYSENKLLQRQQNLIYIPNVARAVAGGFDASGNAVAGGKFSRVLTGFSESSTTFVVQPALDPFARTAGVDVAALANVYGAEIINAKSGLDSWHAQVVGAPFALPAGDVGFAAGYDYRKERFSGMPDENSRTSGPTARRWQGGTFFDPFSASRKVDAWFGELRLPITSPSKPLPGFHALDLTYAQRMEKYSDVGSSSVPKIGVRWQPVDEQFTARFTYSEAYSAPTLFAEFGPTTTSQTGAAVIPAVFPGITGTINGGNGNNPSLKPASAWTRSAGFALSPKNLPGLTVTLDYMNAFQKGLPAGAGAINILDSVERLGPASPFVHNVTFNSYPFTPGAVEVTAAGQLGTYIRGGGALSNLYLQDFFVNLAGVQVKAFDLGVDYRLKTNQTGQFTFHTAATYFETYKFQSFPDQPFFDYTGTATSGDRTGTLPEWRAFTTVEWQRGGLSLMVANTFIPGVTDLGTGGTTASAPLRVASYTAWDLQARYKFGQGQTRSWWSRLRGMEVIVGVNNVFDRMGPVAPNAFPTETVDISTYSPIGRLVYLSTKFKF